MKNHAIGVDIGGTVIKAALIDSKSRIIKKTERPTCAEKGIVNFAELLKSTANELRDDSVAGIGIGIAGVINRDRDTLIESPNLPGFNNYKLKKELASMLNTSVYMENDANCAALGEMWTGTGKNLDSFLFITLGTGVGSGLILNRRLWTGDEGKAGEFGHSVLLPDGPLCACGKRGCLEALSSGSAMVRTAKERLMCGEKSSLELIFNKNSAYVTPKSIYDEAVKGDEMCFDILEKSAKMLAIGISNVNNLLDIDNYIIGGGVSKSFHLVEEYLVSEVKRNVFPTARDRITISLSELGNDAGVYGAGYLVFNKST